MQRLDHLATFTSEPGRLTRLYLTAAHRRAADQVAQWMFDAGMSVQLDGAATLVGHYEASEAGAPALLLGSHIDTVEDAGRYDGNLGVLAAIEAVAALNDRGRRLPFAVEVLAFGDEEGVRFPTTLTGSRAIAGTFDETTLDVEDESGATLADALAAFGCDASTIPFAARTGGKAIGYVELHIEQGPVLQELGLPLGVVTAINGASRFRCKIVGMAGHAGTVPMGQRRDALTAAADMVLAIERIGGSRPHLVATAGHLDVQPGAPNVIPGTVRFTIDLRAPLDADRYAAVEDLQEVLQAIARRRRVELTIQRTYTERAVACDPIMAERLSAAVSRMGYPAHLLPSGAGHDAMAIGAAMPMGMLFLRCRDGISHNPAEEISEADADLAVRVLIDLLDHPEAFVS